MGNRSFPIRGRHWSHLSKACFHRRKSGRMPPRHRWHRARLLLDSEPSAVNCPVPTRPPSSRIRSSTIIFSVMVPIRGGPVTGYLRGRRRIRRLRSWTSRRSDSRSSPSDSKTRSPFSALANAGSPMAPLSEHAADGRDTDSGPSSKTSPAAHSWGSSSVRRPWRPPRRGANPPRHSLERLVAGASEYRWIIRSVVTRFRVSSNRSAKYRSIGTIDRIRRPREPSGRTVELRGRDAEFSDRRQIEETASGTCRHGRCRDNGRTRRCHEGVRRRDGRR